MTIDPVGPFASTSLFETPLITGAVVSPMVTVKLPVVVLPWPSFAEQFTVVTPMGNGLPEAGEQLGVTEPATRSVALAEYVTTLPDVESACALMFAGRLRAGFVVSCTTTENGPSEALLPAPSVAVQVTGVEPSGNVEPDGCDPQSTLGATPLLSLVLTV